MGVVLVVVGVVGYFNQKRRHGREGVRQFLIWYAFAWPFLACALCAGFYPRLHWLYYVDFGLAVAAYAVQIWGLIRARAAAKSDRPPLDS